MTQKDSSKENRMEIIKSVVSSKVYDLLNKCFIDELTTTIPVWLGLAKMKDLIIYCPVSIHAEVLSHKQDLLKLTNALDARQIYIYRVDKAYVEYSGSNPNFNVTEYLLKHAKSKDHRRWIEMCWLSETPLVGTDR